MSRVAEDTLTVENLYGGGFVERINLAIEKVLRNCLDINCDEFKSRKVIAEIEFKPDNKLGVVGMKATVKTNEAPFTPIKVNLLAGLTDRKRAYANEIYKERNLEFEFDGKIINMDDKRREEDA